MKDPVYAECECGGEIVAVQYDKDMDSFYVSIYSLDWRKGWKEKLKLIWFILKNGHPYTDQVIVKREDMAEVTGYIAEVGLEKYKEQVQKDNP